jgi:heme oxygenase
VTPPRAPPTSPSSVSIAAAVDRAIAPYVDELRKVPLHRKVREGTVSKEQYCDLLQSLLTFHREFERAVAQASHLPGFDGPTFRREEALLLDLRICGGRLPIRAPKFLEEFERVLPGWTKAPSVALVGALLVLDHERLESIQFVPQLARALRLKVAPRSGLDYWLDHSAHASRRAHALTAWIDENVRQRERAKEVVVGAVQTLRALATIHRDCVAAPA